MLRTVHLHGRLAERFGRQHRLDVGSGEEAIRALAFQLDGFADHIREGRYAVTVGRGSFPEIATPLTEDSLDLRLGNQTDIHICPAGAVSGLDPFTLILIGVLAVTAIAGAAAFMMAMKAPKAEDREEATKRASFVFDGAENVIEQGHPVQLVYGEMRVGSIVASSGIVTADYAFDPSNPPGGTSDGPGGVPGAGWSGDVSGLDGLIDFTTGFSPIITPEPEHIDTGLIVYGGGGGKGGGQQDPPTEAENNLQSAATARVLEIISEGECVGLVDGLKSVFLDDTVLRNADGSDNFHGVLVEQRVGLPDQSYIQGFAQAENTLNVGTQVKVGSPGPITRSINNPDCSMARVTIRVPALVKTNSETGDIVGTKVSVVIAVQVDGGGFTNVYTMTIDGKTNSGYERSVQFPIPPGLVRDIRVTRTTPDSTTSTLQNDTYWSMLTEVVEAKLTYPDTCLIGLTVDARQFGNTVPSRSYHWRGLVIEVPTNYDPETRTYAGVWDGTFKRAWSNSPPWVLRDLIVNRRYGLGQRIPESALDKWSLYAIAQYCDGLVPDGKGGTEPRFTLNACINNQVQAYDLLASIAGAFRGLLFWSSGSIVATQDRPEDPSILLTPSNVVDGKFRYGRLTPHDKRRSVAVVYWNDPDDSYKLAPVIHEDAELIRKIGRRTGAEVTAFGCTSEGQAVRFAKWIMEDERPSSNASVNYAVGDDHSFVEPGRVAVIADPMFTASRRGGRVRESTANSVTIDRPFEVVGGQVYTLRVMLPDGTVRLRPVTNAAGEATVITLGGAAFAANPNPGAVWSIESEAIANRQFRIRAIETDTMPYEVRALLHDPTKYARVEFEQDLEPPAYFGLPTGPLVPPFDLGVTEFLMADGTASVPSALFGWSPGNDPRIILFQARYRPAGGDWINLEESNSTSRTVRNIAPGDYEFQVRGVDATGRRTTWQSGTGTMDGQADGMPEVIAPGLVVNEGLFSVKLTWFAPIDTRPLRYEIMFDVDGVYASAGSVGITDRLEYTVTEPGTYWVRTTFIGFVSPAPIAIPAAALVFTAGITPYLTNDAFVVPASSDGTVLSYTGASGSVVVMAGNDNISSNFALSTPGGGNPQSLTVNYVGQTYTVTDGLDPGEATGTLVIRATGSGDYAGVVLDKVFTIGKARQGVSGYWRDIRFKRSLAQPATPTGDNPAGWTDGVPAGTETVWASTAQKTYAGALLGSWTTPQPFQGLTARGDYSAVATYYLGNWVFFNGGSYIATQDNFSGQAPTGTAQANAYWDVLAAPGAVGEPAVPPSAFSATIDVPSGAGVNLRNLADVAGYTGLSDATVTFEVESGIVARGLGGGPGLRTGTWPVGSYTITLSLVIKSGGIVDGGSGEAGMGGEGGDGGNGGQGGDAIYCESPISINVQAGSFVRAGGGGGGGGGGKARFQGPPGEEELILTFGHGGGFGANGSGNSTAATGGGGFGGGAGGAGGAQGASGSNGGTATGTGTLYGGGAGGPPGYAIRKNGHTVPVTPGGTIVGTQG